MVTTMAMKATDMGIELKGTTIAVTKHMLSEPRRIGQIDVTLTFAKELVLSEKDKTILERVGNNCPVIKSLHPDVVVNATYI
jgi:putative redox protein